MVSNCSYNSLGAPHNEYFDLNSLVHPPVNFAERFIDFSLQQFLLLEKKGGRGIKYKKKAARADITFVLPL